MEEQNFIIRQLLQENAQFKLLILKLEFALQKKEEIINGSITEEASDNLAEEDHSSNT